MIVTLAILGIALAIAIPNVSIWLVRSRIQAAAGNLQQDVLWAKGYAIRSGYPVAVSIQGVAGACAWGISSEAPNPARQNVPQMLASQYATEYLDTPCQIQGALTAITFSVTPSGLVTDTTGGVTSAAVAFQSGSDPAEYGYWLIQISGAGDIRSCAASIINGAYTCNLQ